MKPRRASINDRAWARHWSNGAAELEKALTERPLPHGPVRVLTREQILALGLGPLAPTLGAAHA